MRHAPGRSSVAGVVGVEGREVTLSCLTAPPGYPPPAYTWWRTDSPSETLGTAANLTLTQLQLGDGGRSVAAAYKYFYKSARYFPAQLLVPGDQHGGAGHGGGGAGAGAAAAQAPHLAGPGDNQETGEL